MNNDVMQDSCPGPNCDVQRQFYSLTTKIVDGADALTDIFVEGMTPHSAIQSVMAFRGGIPATVNGAHATPYGTLRIPDDTKNAKLVVTYYDACPCDPLSHPSSGV